MIRVTNLRPIHFPPSQRFFLDIAAVGVEHADSCIAIWPMSEKIKMIHSSAKAGVDATVAALKSVLPEHGGRSAYSGLIEKDSPAQGVAKMLEKALEEPPRLRAQMDKAAIAPNRNAQYISQQSLHFHGPVGGVQNGPNNTMHVKQTVSNSQSANLDALFQALHSTIATLPKDVQRDATDVAAALESETRSEAPKLPLIKAYVRELKDASVEVSESATDVMNWCLENFCHK